MPRPHCLRSTQLAILSLLCLLTVALSPSRTQARPGPRVVAPQGSLPLGGKLHSWTYCPAKSLVAAAVGERVFVGRLDLPKKRIAKLATLEADSWALAFSGDCKLLAISEHSGEGKDRTNGASLWRVGARKLTRLASLGTYRYPVSSLALSQDSRWAAVTTNVSKLVVYRLGPQGAVERTYEAPPLANRDMYMRVKWSRARLLGGTYQGHVRLFTLDPATGRLGPPRELLSPTVATRKEGSVNLDTGKIVMPGGARVFAVEFTNKGRRAWAAVESGQVFTWDISSATGRGAKVIDGFDGPNAMAVSPDGKQLAVTGNTKAQLWRLKGTRAKPLATLGGLDHVEQYLATNGLGYIENGRLLVGTGMRQSKLLIFKP